MNGDTIFLLACGAIFVGVWFYTGKGGASFGGGSRLGKLLRQLDAAIDDAAWDGTAADLAADRKAQLRRKLAESIDPKGEGAKS